MSLVCLRTLVESRLRTDDEISGWHSFTKQYTGFPTEVSHLDVVVGLCSDDPKDFYNLEDRSLLRADHICENIYYTLPVLLCWFRLYSRLWLYSHLLTASQPLFTASQPSTALQPLLVTCGYFLGTRIGLN